MCFFFGGGCCFFLHQLVFHASVEGDSIFRSLDKAKVGVRACVQNWKLGEDGESLRHAGRNYTILRL